MALEPKEITAEEPEDHELRDMTRRFAVSAVLSLPLLAVAMGHMLIPAVDTAVPGHVRVWIEFALATPVVLWDAWPFFARFAASLRTRNLNMFTLIGLGVGVAYLYSVVALLIPGVFPAQLKEQPEAGGVRAVESPGREPAVKALLELGEGKLDGQPRPGLSRERGLVHRSRGRRLRP